MAKRTRPRSDQADVSGDGPQSFAAVEVGLTDDQRHTLGRVARVFVADKGVSIVSAVEHCRRHPAEVAALGQAVIDLAQALQELPAATQPK